MDTLTNAVETTATNNVVLNDVVQTGFDAKKPLLNLETKRIGWEGGAYRTSNLELYGILAECLGYAGELTFAESKLRNTALEEFFKSRGYKYNAETPVASRVIKAVFGNIDRRRVSTYSLVLRQAIKEKVSPLSLASWIEEKGGIQEIKLGHSATYVSPSDKAGIGKNYFGGKTTIGNAKSELLSYIADAENMGNPCVLLAEQMPDGSFDIKAVVRTTAALNAAYLGLYKQQNEAIDKAKAVVQAANDADGAIAKQA
jgi:hypothetical protein